MDNYSKQILSENQETLVRLNNQLGIYINDNDSAGFCILTKALNQIIDQRQHELLIRSQEENGNNTTIHE